MKYRSRTEIIGMILQSVGGGATKTRLMYGAYLSYAQLKEYLALLLEKELISYEQGTASYKLTERGVRFLSVYDEISDMISLKNNKRANLIFG